MTQFFAQYVERIQYDKALCVDYFEKLYVCCVFMLISISMKKLKHKTSSYHTKSVIPFRTIVYSSCWNMSQNVIEYESY